MINLEVRQLFIIKYLFFKLFLLANVPKKTSDFE